MQNCNGSHLFYVQKVFGFKVNCSTLDWTIFIKGPTVTHIGSHRKCYWFSLWTTKKPKTNKIYGNISNDLFFNI